MKHVHTKMNPEQDRFNLRCFAFNHLLEGPVK